MTEEEKAHTEIMRKYDAVLDGYLDGRLDKIQLHVRMFAIWTQQYGEKTKEEPAEAVKA